MSQISLTTLKDRLNLIRAQGVGVYTQRQDLERQRQIINNQITIVEASMLKLDGREEMLQELIAEEEEFQRVDAENRKKAEADRLAAATKPELVQKVVDKLVEEKKQHG